jgi:leader peptidase (prepilin peptidase) / N-methyltransferase
MPTEALVGGLLGGLLGLAADRLAARWPAHADGAARGVDWRTGVVVMAGLLAFGGLAARWSEPRDLVVLGIYVAALIVLLATDLDQRLLPDLITLPLIVYAAAVTLLPPLVGDPLNPLVGGKSLGAVSAIAAAVLAPLLLVVSDRIFKGALGMGDVKLAVSLGLMCGISLLLVGFLLASVAFAIVVLVLLAARRLTLKTAIPFGPALIGAGIVATLLPGSLPG